MSIQVRTTSGDLSNKVNISVNVFGGGVSSQAEASRLAIAKGLGHPIISTSATHPDGQVFEDPSLLHDYFIKTIDVVIDGGPVSGSPSSVVSLIDDIPEIIRYGAGDVNIFE